MAIAAHDQMPKRSYVDPGYKFPAPESADFAAHVHTYQAFVRYSLIFGAHVGLVLALMAYFLTG